ncbi:hypothetical protein HB772_00225 [Sinorhizobium meliloti]|nr:hypothetical protein HB772_00225 [Sinorhizobium meliloti]
MFKAEKAAMASALAITNSVVERRSTIPILQNVLFEKDSASSDKLIARFTNLDIEATARFSAEVDSDFEAFTVPAGTLSDIVNKLPDGAEIALLPDRTNGLTGVTLKSGRSRFKLPVLPADDFATMKVGELPLQPHAAGHRTRGRARGSRWQNPRHCRSQQPPRREKGARAPPRRLLKEGQAHPGEAKRKQCIALPALCETTRR